MKNTLLSTTGESEHQVYGSVAINAINFQRLVVFEFVTAVDKSLLIHWDAVFVFKLFLDRLYHLVLLHHERDGPAGECLDENLHFFVN